MRGRGDRLWVHWLAGGRPHGRLGGTDSAGRRHLADMPWGGAHRYDLDVPGGSGPSQAEGERFRVGDRVVVTGGYDGSGSNWLRGGNGYVGTSMSVPTGPQWSSTMS